MLEVVRCVVGECPWWDAETQTLYFIDVAEGRIFKYNERTGETSQEVIEGQIGSLALTSNGGQIIAVENRVVLRDATSGQLEVLAHMTSMDETVRLNDGKVDRRGRFIVGAVDRGLKRDSVLGELYSIDIDGRVSILDNGFSCVNGPCWSPDDRTFYVADSLRQVVYAYDYDVERGSISNKRTFVNTEEFGGMPDGATVDAEGCLWTALPRAGKVACFRPDGVLERFIEVPMSWPSSLMFGGSDLTKLFVTSIHSDVVKSPHEPQSGFTFVVDGLGVRGVAESRFRG